MTDLELLTYTGSKINETIGELPTETEVQPHVIINGVLRAAIANARDLGWSLEDIVIAVGVQNQIIQRGLDQAERKGANVTYGGKA
jgi:hypothetical protein